MLFQAAHCTPMAGHLGEAKTRERLMARFFWPGLHENVRRWCTACRECQLVNPPATAKEPLRPLPLMEVPFERIGMDLIGPLERSARGYRFALVLVDYATRYPEVVPLCSFSTHLPSGNPERDSHGSGHGVYVPHAKGTVRAIGH